ncbi:MAG: GIY-YIG nuclease family protein, partial [Proteobacteria bacterium]|nr:GIY-YIG nuclease family protein [Pseudomonadota bacterium]
MNSKKNTSGVEVINNFVKTLPSTSGIYQMHDKNGRVLYVGKAKNLKKRVISYTKPEKQSVRIQRMIHLTDHMEFTKTTSEAEALLLEANMIKKLKPRYNILLRDDKSFPYICITTNHDYPLVKKHRGMQKKGEEYFGPFASTRAVNQTLDILHKVFMLRNCTDNVFKQRSRPCMQYQIKRCTAPCVDKVSKAEYQKQVDMARQFLLGKNKNIQKQLTKQMQKASDALRYEEAS